MVDDLKVVFLACFFTMVLMLIYMFHLNTVIDEKDATIDKLNDARIRAENKLCCQIIQERYIDKRISEDGLSFIYEEHPKIVECSGEKSNKGKALIIVHANEIRNNELFDTDKDFFFWSYQRRLEYLEHFNNTLMPFIQENKNEYEYIFFTLPNTQTTLNIDLSLDKYEYEILYDTDKYKKIKNQLEDYNIVSIDITGYALDSCVLSNTIGYENLKNDFDVNILYDYGLFIS